MPLTAQHRESKAAGFVWIPSKALMSPLRPLSDGLRISSHSSLPHAKREDDCVGIQSQNATLSRLLCAEMVHPSGSPVVGCHRQGNAFLVMIIAGEHAMEQKECLQIVLCQHLEYAQ